MGRQFHQAFLVSFVSWPRKRLWSSKYVICITSFGMCSVPGFRMGECVVFHPNVRTFTSLSQPAETITGFWGLGLNRTHETHSVWPFSVMVNLQSPRVFQSLIVRSRAPETIWRLSAENETERTSLVWPIKVRVVFPVDNSHKRRVLSQEDDRA